MTVCDIYQNYKAVWWHQQLDDIQNRIKLPELHEIDDNGHGIAERKVFAPITMYIHYYIDTNEKEDIRKCDSQWTLWVPIIWTYTY